MHFPNTPVGSQSAAQTITFVINQPVNLSERPTKVAEADEILVIPTQAAPAEPEAAVLLAYWKAIWQAGEDAAARQAATDTLSAALDSCRFR